MASAAAGPTSEYLLIIAPNTETVRIHLEKQQYRLGRAPGNELAFPADQKLSRENFVLDRCDGSWIIKDLKSRNGTLVNGQRITEPTCLLHGDRLAAGHLVLRYDARGEFAEATLTDVQFVSQELTTGKHTISSDLKSALAEHMHAPVAPSMQNSHLGALVRAVRDLGGKAHWIVYLRLFLTLRWTL